MWPFSPKKPTPTVKAKPKPRAILTVTSISRAYDGGAPTVTLTDGRESMYSGTVHLPAIDGLACVRVGDEVILIPGTPAKTGC